MGKKQKKQSVVPHREAFMRMNFLLQASLAVLSADPSRPQLSRFYVHTMKSVSKRLVLRMDPSVKRMVCKSCDSLLVSGVTATHRVRACRERHLVVKCVTCGRLKRFLARPNHTLWSDKSANVADQSGTTGDPSTVEPSAPKPSKKSTNVVDQSCASGKLSNVDQSEPKPSEKYTSTVDQSVTSGKSTVDQTVPKPSTTLPSHSTDERPKSDKALPQSSMD